MKDKLESSTNLHNSHHMNKYVKKTILYCAITLILGIVLGLLSELVRHPRGEPVTITVTDTITLYKPIEVRDSIIREIPARLRTVTDTLYVESVRIERDTVEVMVPITQKEYSDSDYHAWVSGYLPSLDSIKLYRTTITRTMVETPKWGLSVGVGAAIGPRVEPCIFLGITYTIKTF